ncbi:FGGY-family carbohydrate kinase [Salinispira pacifica]
MTHPPLFAALDCGLTATKAVIFDSAGSVVAQGRRATEVESRGGRSELDMERQWRITAEAMREALSQGGVDPESIACVAVSGHGAGLYPVDDRLEPAGRAITSMDARAAGVIEAQPDAARSVYPLTRHYPWAGQPIPLLVWLKQQEPQEYRRIRWVLAAKDWAVLRLTGVASADLTDSSNCGLVAAEQRRYDPRILSSFGIPEAEAWLPPLSRSADIVGEVTASAAAATGLRAGTPVAAGLFDVIACALGSGVHNEERFSVIAGTWNINTALDPVLQEAAQSVKCSLGADAQHYAYVESSATSAVNLEWLVRTFRDGATEPDRYAAASEAAAATPPALADPIYLPYLYRSHLGADRGAAFFGLRPEHGFGEVARAVMEGVCFAHRAHLEILGSCGLVRGAAVLSGGASRSRYWAGLFADVLRIPVELAGSPEAGALGAAVTASVAAGVHDSIPDAIASMVRVVDRCEPRHSSAALYEERYARFRALSV